MKKFILVFLALLLSITVPALAAYDEDTDYMEKMISCAVSGDIAGGTSAENSRNEKISVLGLDCTPISFEDLNLLAKIMYSEAGSNWLSDEWKMSVGEVVLNRVASPSFPDTVSGVVYQAGQYYGANSSYFNNLKPDERCVRLALRLLEGERVIGDASVVYQSNSPQGSGVHTIYYDSCLGTTYFCY